MKGLVVDLFAGGGGASTGIEAALGRPVDIAINHSEVALAVHEANHPDTKHFVSDVFDIAPKLATGGKPVTLLWLSPDCKHFSNAKGNVPRDQGIRSLAWVGVRWARDVRPSVICLENVREFLGWGPLGPDGRPDKSRAGETFARWRGELEQLGYVVDYRILDASEYGAPTKRKRLFLVARCDGEPITWPEPTHGPGREPLRTAAECIDWTLPCPSIFERKRPLAEKTLWRIAQGIRRYVLESPKPFIVKVNHGKWEPRHEDIEEPLSTITATQRGHAIVTPYVVGAGGPERAGEARGIGVPFSTILPRNTRAFIAPTLVQTGYGERPGQRPRSLDLHEPLGTVVGCGQKHALVAAFLAKHYGDPLRKTGGGVVVGSDLREPTGTVTTRDHHSLAAVALAKFRGTDPSQPGSAAVDEPLPTISAGGIHVGEVRAFLSAYYGSDGTGGQMLTEPMRTLTAKHRLGIVTVAGVDYQITEIGFRMLEPHELLRAQFGDFAEDYDLSAARTKAAKVRLIGNSVPPDVVRALVASNLRRGEVRAA